MMTKWQYTFLLWNMEEPRVSEEEMNSLGQEGWELVQAGIGLAENVFVFKRPMPSVADMQFSMALKSDDPMAVANLSAYDGARRRD
jgi:hypothetical protein